MVVGCLLSALYLWLTLRQINTGALVATLRQVSLPLIPLFLGLALLTLAARAARIALSLVREQPVSAWQASRSMMAGYFTNLILPQPAGEIARITVATRDLGVTPAAATAAIAIERVLDLMLALLLVAVAAPFAAHMDARLQRATQILTAAAVVAGALLALAMWAPNLCRWLCAPIFALLPAKISNWCRHHFEDLLQALTALTNAHRILRYLTLSVAQTALWGCCIAVSLWAVDIAPLPVPVVLTTALFTLALLLPAAPGYIGSVQLAYTVALVPLGISSEKAFAASLYLHLLFNGMLVVLGIALLGRSVAARTDAKS